MILCHTGNDMFHIKTEDKYIYKALKNTEPNFSITVLNLKLLLFRETSNTFCFSTYFLMEKYILTKRKDMKEGEDP